MVNFSTVGPCTYLSVFGVSRLCIATAERDVTDTTLTRRDSDTTLACDVAGDGMLTTYRGR